MPVEIQTLLLAFVVTAGWLDLRARRVPNWLTVSGVIAGIAGNAFFQPHGSLIAMAGIVCALVVYVPLYALRGMGAGDVKLMAAVGAFAGPSAWIAIFLATALLGGVAALTLIAVKKRVGETFMRMGTILTAVAHKEKPTNLDDSLDIRSERALKMPHGALIASGAMLTILIARAWNWNW